VARQTLSMRWRTPAHPRRRRYVREPQGLFRGYSSSAGACSCFPW